MKTIKIRSSDLASQGPFVIINASDFDSAVHEVYDEESYNALRGASTASHLAPSPDAVLAAAERLQELERRLAEREAELAAREQANAAEAQRLADEKAALTAAGTGAPDYSTMTKDELQAALTAQGKSFPAAANKADLIALLTGA